MNQTCQPSRYRLAAAPSRRSFVQMPVASMSLSAGLWKQGGQTNFTVFQVVDGITDTRGGPI